MVGLVSGTREGVLVMGWIFYDFIKNIFFCDWLDVVVLGIW